MDWKSIVKTVAPALGTALGGPLAGTAVREIAGKWLGDDTAGADQIEQAVQNATPEQLAELRKIDADFQTKMRELDIDVYKTEVEDRKDARSMAKTNMLPQIAITIAFVVGYFVMFYAFMQLSEMDAGTSSVVSGFLGVITAGMQQILSFWFGSSKGSQDKDRAIHQARTGAS